MLSSDGLFSNILLKAPIIEDEVLPGLCHLRVEGLEQGHCPRITRHSDGPYGDDRKVSQTVYVV